MNLVKSALVAATLSALALPALADDRRVDRSDWLSVGEISSRLEAAGYTRITDIESDDGLYEVDATSPEGHRVDLDVDPRTGAVVRSERDD
ncbi:PepSY domain-containing protein [Terrihabitans sp. B22-R8]|uniref:PepSY domain-containing protein n=1 Tax=Terrihabitans sp. B22-R8 TaxID=3425128 RepID=UPI00403C9DE0